MVGFGSHLWDGDLWASGYLGWRGLVWVWVFGLRKWEGGPVEEGEVTVLEPGPYHGNLGVGVAR